ncbi:hypothetical protein HOP50_01g01480 [Chloropicon primus]|uniref:Uncharacterized protein n=1 Tax=Chloropicon primus TaxID=1764295 RepID=A0A5B8MBX8_9CHLO|nr:hypothetical protein A3770_01p01590 [Chloropicon primus]UPQ96857.1 hypothetical protein HOP50_01g01480 [Chloropicon primus]|eukprot:QDZ17641.1 hypothetical protein A3770_01p01590 [Chloropicon primus]
MEQGGGEPEPAGRGKGQNGAGARRERGGRSRSVRGSNLRGDVIRKGLERGGRSVRGLIESYTDFFARVDSEDAIVGHREWLANKDDIYLVYCHLVGAGFSVDAVRRSDRARAYYVLASKRGAQQKSRTVAPVSVGCPNLTPAWIHLVVDECPQYEEGLVKGGREVTLAFVDSDSVHLLPVSGTLPTPT